MKLGVVGLPNVGKSTLFNAITRAGAEAANYPFCTIEPNTGVVPVPDARLSVLARIYEPEKVTPAIIEFVDIAGLVRGASKGEGLGNKFLSHIREVDAIVHVVRCFEDENVVHVEGGVDALRDMETVNTELILSDIESLTKRADRVRRSAQSGDAKAREEIAIIDLLMASLDKGLPARAAGLTPEQFGIASGYFLLTTKPVLYAANIAEDDLMADADNLPQVSRVRVAAEAEHAGLLTICARVEEEIAGMPGDEREEFLKELGIGESGLSRLVKVCYNLLGLQSFLTAGPKEVRAWTIPIGTKAPQAAGVIHTDFERGFIRAEVVQYDALVEHGSINACKEKGLMRSEGKEYVMKDGDVVLFRFNV